MIRRWSASRNFSEITIFPDLSNQQLVSQCRLASKSPIKIYDTICHHQLKTFEVVLLLHISILPDSSAAPQTSAAFPFKISYL